MPFPYLIAHVALDDYGDPLLPMLPHRVGGMDGRDPQEYFVQLDPAQGWPYDPDSYLCYDVEGDLAAPEGRGLVLFSADLIGGPDLHDAKLPLSALKRASWADNARIVWGTFADGHQARAESAATTEPGAARVTYQDPTLDDPLTLYLFSSEDDAYRYEPEAAEDERRLKARASRVHELAAKEGVSTDDQDVWLRLWKQAEQEETTEQTEQAKEPFGKPDAPPNHLAKMLRRP